VEVHTSGNYTGNNGPPYERFADDWGADKSLARPGRKQATATEESDVHIPYLFSKLEEY